MSKLRNSRALFNPSILNNLIFEVFTPNFVLPAADRVKQEPRQPLSDLPEADRVVESNDAEVQYSLYLYLKLRSYSPQFYLYLST